MLDFSPYGASRRAYAKREVRIETAVLDAMRIPTMVRTRFVEASGNTLGAVTSWSIPLSFKKARKVSWFAASLVKSSSSNMDDL